MPTGKGLGAAVRVGKSIGCTAVQVFTSSPKMWSSKPITEEAIAELAAALAESQMGPVVSHDSYLINLCAPAPETKAKSIEALARELHRCGQLGIPYVVSHMGAHMGQGEEEGLRQVAAETKAILADAPPGVTLLMETTAGQGSSLNWKFEHLSELFSATGAPSNLGVCLDTCHIFAAGYDIRTQESYEATFEQFNHLVGIGRLKVIHCNDSKKPLGSRVDRHDHLGEGEIGETAFRLLVSDPRFDGVPILVETPDAETMHAVNVGKLWSWVEA